ncbi:MAG TPA: MBL fold metallo-hydrolase [Anaerolineae bacterium]|nr:MBL fold metallo-hydrolase [Anaerolineae bacterium]
MPNASWIESKHFTLKPLNKGVYACIHKPGGAAYSSAGILDLGDSTLLVDAFDTLAAARDLRHNTESLFERPVEMIILTHAHSDHWIGASVFDANTTLLASKTTRQVCLEWGAEIVNEFQDTSEWEEWIKKAEKQLRTEQDERVRVGLESSITRTRYAMAEMVEFQPRYADQTFDDVVIFQGSKRGAELRSLGRGHSEDDAVLLLPQDGIAFIGDIGFFDTQPFLGFCDIDLYRKQLLFFQDSDFQVLVPGHGPVGDKDDVALQLKYFDMMEDLVGTVVQRGGSFEEAMQITLPEPFDKWLIGGMERFKVNVRYLFERFGGEVLEEE